MRGLKQVISITESQHGVASFTDAWIETPEFAITGTLSPVASFTDAWIETYSLTSNGYLHFVASFTDAWIETGVEAILPSFIKSHLLQMRGLKPGGGSTGTGRLLSHLLQMRGLKHG